MKETATHLFLLCPFARGCWHGSTLAIHFSDYNTIFVQQWLTQLLSGKRKLFHTTTHTVTYLTEAQEQITSQQHGTGN